PGSLSTNSTPAAPSTRLMRETSALTAGPDDRLATEILDGDGAELCHKALPSLLEGRLYDIANYARRSVAPVRKGRALPRPSDFTNANRPAIARQSVAAERSASARENFVSDERL